MPATVPRMHGLTHVAGGPDPIPGAAGGALDWEDVGTGSQPYPRYAMFRGANLLLSAGYSLGWLSMVASYDPAGEVSAMDPGGDAASLLLKSAGVFKIEVVEYVTSGPTANMRLTLNSTGGGVFTALSNGAGLVVYDAATAVCIGGLTAWVRTTDNTGKIKIGIAPASGTPDHTICITKVSS